MRDETVTHTDHRSGPNAAATASVPVLTLVHHREETPVGRRHLLRDGETIVLGRTEGCFGPGVLDDSRISRRHLEVARSGERVRVTDLGSRNGSFLNGEPIREAELSLGDVIAIGGVMLLFHRGPVFHEPTPHPTLVGIGAAMAAVVEQVRRVAPHEATVLVQGESGVGKELVARALHDESRRAGPFVPINCGSMAEGVASSELFGHARGAFSGAHEARAGLIETARGGTLLLDEVADAPPSLQASLLRLLETGDYRPVGSDRLMKAQTRFVAATHVPLDSAAEEGRFRRDLFGRLDRYVVRIPPLRERREDILPLVRHLGRRIAGREIAIGRPLAIALLRHHWPQNVRELAAVVEQAVIEQGADSPLQLTPTIAQRFGQRPAGTAPDETPERPDRERLRHELARRGGNVKALAGDLGVARSTLYRWLHAAGIDPEKERR